MNFGSRRPSHYGGVKTSFKISLFLNLGLVGCLVWVLTRRPETNTETPAPVGAESGGQPSAGIAEPPPPASAGGQTKPFRWSQLESTDYRIYIANLRGIGCPELTVRDIITADLDGLYAPKREALRGKLPAAGGSTTAGMALQRQTEAGLAALRSEEAATLATLLGPAPTTSPVATDSDSAPVVAAAPRRNAEAAVSMPLVFQDVDLSALKLNERQIRALADMRQSFMDEVGGPDQDPNDPGYRERWLKAQPEIDASMRGMIGANAFLDYQVAARARQQAAGGQ